MSDVVAVDLFCGIGGLTLGLEQVGVDVRVGVDADEVCQYPFEANTNAEFLIRDVAGVRSETDTEIPDLRVEELQKRIPDDSILILGGCAPCQPFSNLNNGSPNSDHENWDLLLAMRDVVEKLDPDIVTMENVKGLAEDEIYKKDFFGWFQENDEYEVWDNVVDCTDYQVPQRRERLILLASKFGEIELIPPTTKENDVLTVRRTFSQFDAQPLEAGEWKPKIHQLHKAAGLRGSNPERMRHTGEGEDWHDLPEELRPPSEEDSSYTAYGRMWWDEPAPTLTTNFYNWGSGRFGHPGFEKDESESVDRAISLFEGALLQTFPEEFKMVKNNEEPANKLMGRLIGNAVPVRLATAVAGSIRRHLVKSTTGVEFNEGNASKSNNLPYEEMTKIPESFLPNYNLESSGRPQRSS